MPTSRPRHTLTETEELSAALQPAAQRWPEDARRPSRLVQAGERAIAPEQRRTRERRLRAIERHHGQFTGMYPPGYLERPRSEWPD